MANSSTRGGVVTEADSDRLDRIEAVSVNGRQRPAVDPPSEAWDRIREKVIKRAARRSTADVLGVAGEGGSAYRWGVAAATGVPCSELLRVLSIAAAGDRPPKGARRRVDLTLAAQWLCDAPPPRDLSVVDAAMLVTWAVALPALIDQLDRDTWTNVADRLIQIHAVQLRHHKIASSSRLILAGELGLTLAWRIPDYPTGGLPTSDSQATGDSTEPVATCGDLIQPSIGAVRGWFLGEADSIADAVREGAAARLVLASVLRCRRIMQSIGKHRLGKDQVGIAGDLAAWVAAMTRPDGTTAFSTADAKSVRDDVALGRWQRGGEKKRKSGGKRSKERDFDHGDLMSAAAELDRETLTPAIAAALGAVPGGGRLAWEVSLPEACWHCDDARLAVMLPQWDVRRGKVAIDYSREDCRIEAHSARAAMIAGDWQVTILSDGQQQLPAGDWELSCEYTDDDSHYLEIEQPWTGDLVLQRQIMIIREDGCVLLADSVLAADGCELPRGVPLRYVSRLPLGPSMLPEAEPETREILLALTRDRLQSSPSRKPAAMVIPLSASEWRIGKTKAELTTSQDGHLVLTAAATDRLYAPLWIDTQSRRLSRKRTWRALTVADELRIVADSEAMGFRIQVGSEQWMVYRCLGPRRPHSVLGKHLVSDFFAARFDPEDGSLEELVTVDSDDE